MLEEAQNLFSVDAKSIFRITESNIDALNTVDLGAKLYLEIVKLCRPPPHQDCDERERLVTASPVMTGCWGPSYSQYAFILSLQMGSMN